MGYFQGLKTDPEFPFPKSVPRVWLQGGLGVWKLQLRSPCRPDSWLLASRPCLLELLSCGSACAAVVNSWLMCPSKRHYTPPGIVHNFDLHITQLGDLFFKELFLKKINLHIHWTSSFLHCERQWINGQLMDNYFCYFCLGNKNMGAKIYQIFWYHKNIAYDIYYYYIYCLSFYFKWVSPCYWISFVKAVPKLWLPFTDTISSGANHGQVLRSSLPCILNNFWKRNFTQRGHAIKVNCWKWTNISSN